MDFELSSDQVALQDAARDLLDDRAGHDQVRAHLHSGRPYDESLWRALAEQGWLAIVLAEADGGVGLSWVEAAVLLEQIGRHTAPVPFLPSLLALMALAGAEEPQREWVGDLASGARLGCVAWSKHAEALVAVGSGPTWTVLGRIGPVEGAAVADIAVVVAGDDVFAVELAVADRPPAEAAMDVTRGCCRGSRSTRPAPGGSAALPWPPRSSTGVLSAPPQRYWVGLIGCSRWRRSTPRIASNSTSPSAASRPSSTVAPTCWSTSRACAHPPGTGPGPCRRRPRHVLGGATAKMWCSDAAKRVMASGLQVHGGIGFTWEHDLHLYMKRSQLDQVNFGDAEYHRERLAGLLRSRLMSGSGLF